MKIYAVRFVWDEGWTPLHFASSREKAEDWISVNVGVTIESADSVEINEYEVD